MTTPHLLLVTIGPVQDFIAQARRTRDLWHGSHMISELSRAVARALAGGGARLLIPALDVGDAELAECWTMIRPETDEPPAAIANKIWALVPADEQPSRLATLAREALQDCLRGHADAVWAKLGDLLGAEVEPVWREQIEDALEFVAGWISVDERPFADIRAELDDEVSARKRLREFKPWTQQRGAAPKSSLDGARESVLPNARRDKGLRARLQVKCGIGKGEELDAIGLIKRAGADPEQFIPLVNVALAPWLAWAAKHTPVELEACRAACAGLEVPKIRSPLLADDFRFEASILLPDRWTDLEEEHGYAEESHQVRWSAAQRAVRELRKAARAPRDEPYVACIVADGDRMGDAISRITEPNELRRFSERLSAFARSTRSIVKDHRGSLVYAGGDDVLAFVPVSEALACAQALRQRFTEVVGGACDHPTPSLSVGVGVGHYMESMGELLALGREAEALAKGSTLAMDERRNALAIIVDKRSGGRRTWRARWDATPEPPAQLRLDMAVMAKLTIGKIHEIAGTLRRLPNDAPPDSGFSNILELEVRRSLARNEGGAMDFAAVELVLPEADYAARRGAVRDWIDRLLIARELRRADPTPRSQREPT